MAVTHRYAAVTILREVLYVASLTTHTRPESLPFQKMAHLWHG